MELSRDEILYLLYALDYHNLMCVYQHVTDSDTSLSLEMIGVLGSVNVALTSLYMRESNAEKFVLAPKEEIKMEKVHNWLRKKWGTCTEGSTEEIVIAIALQVIPDCKGIGDILAALYTRMERADSDELQCGYENVAKCIESYADISGVAEDL